MSEYEKVLEETVEQLHQEMANLKKTLFELLPHMDKVLENVDKNIDKLNNKYFDLFSGCSVIKQQIARERNVINKMLGNM